MISKAQDDPFFTFETRNLNWSKIIIKMEQSDSSFGMTTNIKTSAYHFYQFFFFLIVFSGSLCWLEFWFLLVFLKVEWQYKRMKWQWPPC